MDMLKWVEDYLIKRIFLHGSDGINTIDIMVDLEEMLIKIYGADKGVLAGTIVKSSEPKETKIRLKTTLKETIDELMKETDRLGETKFTEIEKLLRENWSIIEVRILHQS